MRILYSAAVGAVLSLAIANTGQAQTIGYAEAIRNLVAACGADIEKHCKGVKAGGGAISACLAKNNISGQCAATYEAVFVSLAKRAAAQEAAPQLCAAEAKRLCSNYRPGEGHILACLIRPENVRRVTNKCNEAINDAGWR